MDTNNQTSFCEDASNLVDTAIVLASKSPRRQELLSMLNIDFSVVVSDVDERSIEEKILSSRDATTPMNEVAASLTMELSKVKARAVLNKILEENLVDSKVRRIVIVGADTCVVTHDEILGKPASSEDARRMITMLCGITHYVVSGVALLVYNLSDKTFSETTFFEETKVEFYSIDEIGSDLIDQYIEGRLLFEQGPGESGLNEWKDKAGGYAIQGRSGAVFIKQLSGDYYNVVGLPVSRGFRELREIGAI